jgi:hypothetical protein
MLLLRSAVVDDRVDEKYHRETELAGDASQRLHNKTSQVRACGLYEAELVALQHRGCRTKHRKSELAELFEAELVVIPHRGCIE